MQFFLIHWVLKITALGITTTELSYNIYFPEADYVGGPESGVEFCTLLLEL